MEKSGGPLTAAVLRGLSDKLYDKRKVAALEVERLMKELVQQNDKVKLRKVLDTLTDDFAYSTNPNSRKGGLIGLAATAIALGPECIAHYLSILIPAALSCFVDQDSRVRYYACESLYNIAKVARGEVLVYFNQIFDGLSRLVSDTDPNVRNGAELLDRLIKDIVTESTSFQIEAFIPLLRERIYAVNPYARQFLVSWISVLDSVPDIELLDFLPEFLEGIFRILSDSSKDIRKQAETTLGEFLREIKLTKGENVKYEKIVRILVSFIGCKDQLMQFTALSWIKEFLIITKHRMLLFCSEILAVVLPCLSHPIVDIRDCAVSVNQALMKLVEDSQSQDEPLVDPNLDHVAGSSFRGQDPANLPFYIPEHRKSMATFFSNLTSLLNVLRMNLKDFDSTVETRIASLRWLLLLHVKSPLQMLQRVDEFFHVLMGSLPDASDKVVVLALEVLAEIASFSETKQMGAQPNCEVSVREPEDAENRENCHFYRFMSGLLGIFCTDDQLLETRSRFIITQLSLLLHPEKIFLTMADILLKEEDLVFATKMVRQLNNILLTSKELMDLRNQLHRISSNSSHSKHLFLQLYRTWCHDPISTLSLCLLTQNYQHSSFLLRKFSSLDITVEMLLQLDQLVQLLESPVFTYLRFQLLEAPRYPYLLQSLYGILMLLPQGSAFTCLKNRLDCVPILAAAFPFACSTQPSALAATAASHAVAASGTAKCAGPALDSCVDFSVLSSHFDDVCRRHLLACKNSRPNVS